MTMWCGGAISEPAIGTGTWADLVPSSSSALSTRLPSPPCASHSDCSSFQPGRADRGYLETSGSHGTQDFWRLVAGSGSAGSVGVGHGADAEPAHVLQRQLDGSPEEPVAVAEGDRMDVDAVLVDESKSSQLLGKGSAAVREDRRALLRLEFSHAALQIAIDRRLGPGRVCQRSREHR